MLYYNHSSSSALKDLGSSNRGLSKIEAKKRLEQYGPNAIDIKGESLLKKIFEPFIDVFMLVLFIAASISLIQGHFVDAGIIGVVISANAIIFYIQRYSTERVLRSLKQHDQRAVEVRRDDKLIDVDATELVPGDILRLAEGDKVPADARIIEASNVQVDESLLTGESEPITKNSEPLKGEKQVYERCNTLFQGSFITSGEVTAVITRTGNQSEFGQLAALSRQESAISPVQKKINRLIQQIVVTVAVIAVVAFLLALRNGMNLADSLQFVMAISVSAVPESLPIAISVILVLGMRRMALKKALVRNMRAIETVGVLTTIATDKTGTLTKNKLTAQEVWQPDGVKIKIADAIAHTVISGGKGHDPLDTALADYAEIEARPIKGHPAHSLTFDLEYAMSGNIWHSGTDYELFIKGAPEKIIQSSNLTDNEEEAAHAALHRLTSQGYRVIGISKTSLDQPIETFASLPKRSEIEFIGFVAVADILRPEAKKAIQSAQTAGVTIRMITGDHFETAYHIARQLGMVERRDQVFDSRQMGVMSDEELEDIIDNIRVFSRVIPEHKYRILELLKKNNITAMTGDGVNDVPALSNAHVGVSMGSGSQIAKDAGDIILLDDNFKSIIDAMREGRAIIANIRRMLFYLLATNTGEVLLMLGALIIGMPVPLAAVQILWINLVTDTAMVIPLGLEPGESDNMTRKPQHPNAPILSKYHIGLMVLIALSMASLTLGLYALYSQQYGHAYGSTIAFITLVVMQWANAFNARSTYESVFTRLRVFNGKLYIGLAVAIGLQILVIFGPLQEALHIHPVAIGDMVFVSVIAIIIPIALAEIYKFFGRRYKKLA